MTTRPPLCTPTAPRRRGAPVLAALLALAAAPASAQFSQYTAPGSLGLKPVPTREALEESMEAAPWDLGPVRLAPWFSLRDVTYYDNVVGPEGDARGDDLTASLGAGLHGYLPVGRNLIVAGYALPEYVWWRDRDERRLWNGRYGVGVFAYFSRLSFEARSGKAREQQVASVDLEEPINVRADTDLVRFELRVFERLSLFAETEETQFRHRDEDLDLSSGARLSQLDRDQSRAGAGVRYRPREHVTFGVGVDRVESEFLDGGDDRSSSGTGPFVEVEVEGRRLDARGRVAWVSLEPEGASTFAPYDDATGSVSLSWQPGANLTWQAFGGRSLAFAFTAGSPYLVDSRVGGALVGQVGWRGAFRVFYETGTNAYRDSVGGTVAEDDLEAYGVSFDVKLGRHASLVLGGDRTDYVSTVSARDRDVSRLMASVRFSSPTSQWW